MIEDFAEIAGIELVVIDADTTIAARSAASCAGTPPTTGWPRARLVSGPRVTAGSTR